MSITPEDMDELKKHIYDLKYLAYKLGKIKLEEGQKIEDVEFSTSDAIQMALETKLLDLDKDISEKVEISSDKIKALRVMGELHKSLRGERTTVVKGSDNNEKPETLTPLEVLRQSLKIEKLD